jgi:type I restriction enzyme S subunit
MSKWEMVRLGDICVLKSGTSLSPDVLSKDGEIPYVKVSDLNLIENTPNVTMSTNYVSRLEIGRASCRERV